MKPNEITVESLILMDAYRDFDKAIDKIYLNYVTVLNSEEIKMFNELKLAVNSLNISIKCLEKFYKDNKNYFSDNISSLINKRCIDVKNIYEFNENNYNDDDKKFYNYIIDTYNKLLEVKGLFSDFYKKYMQ